MSSRRRSSGKFTAPVVKSTPKASKTTIDESRAAVSATDSLQAALKGNTNEAIEISSGEESDEDVSDEEMEGAEVETGNAKKTVNGTATEETTTTQTKADAEAGVAEDEEEAGSPTFGELIRGTIDVPAMLAQQEDANSKALVSQSSRKGLEPVSLSSLSTVLTQALKTDDTDLLENCLQTSQPEGIKQTIERLDSSLAGILLTKLSARFHRRPGRAGSLMDWVKWTLIVHGGVLATQTKALERLVTLQKVLSERSRGLPSLLALKGKLDMLHAQMELRNGRPRRGDAARQLEDADDEDEEEEGAIYVEGEEDAETANGARNALLGDDDDDEVPAANGFVGDSDDEDDEEEAVAAEDESSGEEVIDEDEVDHNDVEDSDEDDDSDAEAAPPTKVQKTASSFAKRK
ncbi:Dip2/Utp12 family-domain-containing protein [Colletotrichum godetiae]|uniref:Dip2/Utp12 family-domain-containing protein n=1 Tax=Colletotrichum godetiae TaxID=1209918 RepID=A0AAJ0AGA1_9PEZI|nr:Dip2/Utp12 family-domain-containing protein [Colletotrichum godetiae]KAK1671792.1 Dip2/Utp12 family-domain-containing protein [Colletotrichum godetiae]